MSQTINATGNNDHWNTGAGANTSVDVGNDPDFGGVVNGALRFSGVNLNQGQAVQTAILDYYVGLKGGGAGDLKAKIWGIDEDNTGDFSSSPMGRTKTDAVDIANWSLPAEGNYSAHNVTSIVQEIVNRGGWSSGNAIGFIIEDNGSPSDVWAYNASAGSVHARLIITLSSVSASPSSSISATPSPSSSISASPSVTPSATPSPTPPPEPTFPILRIAKPGVDVLLNRDVHRRIFDSDYGTLKYFTKQTVSISFDASTGDISATGSYTHNLGYYPFCEVFVSVNGGNYEYCPFFGSGATVAYAANVKITTDKITVYGEINGVSASVWTFDFLIFVFKNNLNL